MEITLIVISGIVVGLTQLIKQLNVNIKFVLCATIAIAIGLTFIAAPLLNLNDWRETLITGIVVGLQAMGLYSGGKAVINDKK